MVRRERIGEHASEAETGREDAGRVDAEVGLAEASISSSVPPFQWKQKNSR